MTESENFDTMPTEDYEYSIASQLSYDYYDNGNDADQIQRSLDPYLAGYPFDPENSNNNASTFIRPDGSALLAYRGTRVSNIDDLSADAGILFGLHRGGGIQHPRMVEAQDIYNKVKNQYFKVDLTGHSGGGTTADFIGRNNDEKAVVFNPGETILSLHTIPKSTTKKTTIYRTNTFDIVSFSNSLYPHANKIKVIPQTELGTDFLGSHSLNNFLPPQSMLPISYGGDDIIIPSTFKQSTGVDKVEFKNDPRFVSNKCLEKPFLLECQKLKPKIKKL